MVRFLCPPLAAKPLQRAKSTHSRRTNRDKYPDKLKETWRRCRVPGSYVPLALRSPLFCLGPRSPRHLRAAKSQAHRAGSFARSIGHARPSHASITRPGRTWVGVRLLLRQISGVGRGHLVKSNVARDGIFQPPIRVDRGRAGAVPSGHAGGGAGWTPAPSPRPQRRCRYAACQVGPGSHGV